MNLWTSPEAVQVLDLCAAQAVFARLEQDARADLRSVTMSSQDGLVLQAFLNGADPGALHDIRSATKSITALLLGIAMDQGIVGSVEDALPKYFQWVPADKSLIRIRDLLTMRSGLDVDELDPESPGHELRMERSDDFLRFALSLPMAEPSGLKYRYASVTAFLLGALIENASGLRLDRFAARHLFDPLGVARTQWLLAPNGRGKGQGNLFLTASDFHALGMLALAGGTAHGHSLVSESWVRECLLPRVPIGHVDRYADFYCYMWYAKTYVIREVPVEVRFASGNGGNKIYLVPSLHLVITIMSNAYGHPYGQERSEAILKDLLAAVVQERLLDARPVGHPPGGGHSIEADLSESKE